MNLTRQSAWPAALLAMVLFWTPSGWADAVTDWNIKAGEIIVATRQGYVTTTHALSLLPGSTTHG